MAAFELPVPNPVTRVIELRDDPSTAALDREHSVARPWETKTGGLPLRVAGAMNPGEKAIMRVKRSPFVITSERA